MRVAQIISSISNESSGPSYSIPGLCRGLSGCGCDVSLYCLGDVPARLKSTNYEVVNYPRHDVANLGNSHLMKRAMRTLHADIVHNNGMWMFPNVYFAKAKRNGAKLVMAPRGCLAEAALKRGRLKKFVFGHLWQYPALRAADMFHATCEKEYNEIRAAGYKQPVAIVPIGLDLPELNLIKSMGEHNLKKMVFFGRLHNIKGVDKLLLAWDVLHGQLRDWEVVIAGPDDGMLPRLKEIVASKNLPRVSFVGEINGAEKYKFLAKADLYVLPTETENFGITIAEALACKTPVITTKGTPWSGLIDNQCGWWIDNSVDSLVQTIREATSMTISELRNLGENGRKWIANDFSWDTVGQMMKTAYDWLLGRSDRPDWVKDEGVL